MNYDALPGGDLARQDLADVHSLVPKGPVEPERLFELFAAIEPDLYRYPAIWVDGERLAKLNPEEKRRFIPLCPDFVIELRSPTDRLSDFQAKMEEYRANGARLGWLIDPETRRVAVYRLATQIEVLDQPSEVHGDPELPGFTLALERVWQPL